MIKASLLRQETQKLNNPINYPIHFNLYELHFHGRADFISHKYTYVKYKTMKMLKILQIQKRDFSHSIIHTWCLKTLMSW